MNKEYNPLFRIARWLRRFRKRCGYGVHSPFAFDFITGVIYNDDAYYAYEHLRQPLVASIARLDEYDPESGLTAKDLRLLFRITNWAEPSRLYLCGASPTVKAYISAARPSAPIIDVPAPEGHTFIYCDHPDLLDTILGTPPFAEGRPMPSATTLILRGIHSDAASRHLWKQLQDSDLCTVSFDLGRFGIIVRRPKINRQHYVVNYF